MWLYISLNTPVLQANSGIVLKGSEASGTQSRKVNVATTFACFAIFTLRSLAEGGIAKASCKSVRLSVRLSVTLRYRDHIGWNFAKIISRLISITASLSVMLSVDPNTTDLLQREL